MVQISLQNSDGKVVLGGSILGGFHGASPMGFNGSESTLVT